MEKKLLRNLLSSAERKFKTADDGIEYIVCAAVKTVNKAKILCTTMYDASTGVPLFRIFSDRKDFMTWNYEKKKWSDSMIDKFRMYYYCCIENKGWKTVKNFRYDSVKSMTCGAEYYGTTDDTVMALEAFQKSVREKQLDIKHEHIRNEIDKLMAQTRPLPNTFFEWADRVALKNSRYIYYRRHGKKVNGYCTVCKTDVVLDDARHNKPGVCPHCRAHITFKAEGLSKRVMDDTLIEYVQRVNGKQLMVRMFNITKSYCENYRQPKFTAYEESRRILSPDKHSKDYVPNHNANWLDDWKPFAHDFLYAYLYTPNLTSVLHGTAWQYCAIQKYASRTPRFSAAFYLVDYIKHPCVEYLSKLGLFRLIDDWQELSYSYERRTVDWEGKNLREVLGIPKELVPLAIKADISTDSLAVLQKIYKANSSISCEDLIWIKKHYFYSLKDDIEIFLRYMTPHAFIKYVEKQAMASESSESNVISDWKDYIGNASLIGYNMQSKSIVFPKSLKKAHDRAYKLVTVKKDALMTRRIEELSEPLNKQYGFSFGGFFIRPPKSLAELTREGELLHHCVATYAERVAKSKTVILFIRAANDPDTPLFTLEVRDNHVVQVRGFEDHDPTPEGKNFVEKWKQKRLQCMKQKLCA